MGDGGTGGVMSRGKNDELLSGKQTTGCVLSKLLVVKKIERARRTKS